MEGKSEPQGPEKENKKNEIETPNSKVIASIRDNILLALVIHHKSGRNSFKRDNIR
jgi:hypothetical protein